MWIKETIANKVYYFYADTGYFAMEEKVNGCLGLALYAPQSTHAVRIAVTYKEQHRDRLAFAEYHIMRRLFG